MPTRKANGHTPMLRGVKSSSLVTAPLSRLKRGMKCDECGARMNKHLRPTLHYWCSACGNAVYEGWLPKSRPLTILSDDKSNYFSSRKSVAAHSMEAILAMSLWDKVLVWEARLEENECIVRARRIGDLQWTLLDAPPKQLLLRWCKLVRDLFQGSDQTLHIENDGDRAFVSATVDENPALHIVLNFQYPDRD
ncbi:hypothetical protein Pla111_02810 [Botrimarina hoheduenensis]|uniref:Uncharacterized protein n=1 Tax=Botrimarina hoheduenensis TaxID=2528000 RepID=A0A5C5WEL5_9BACT|nr:hypothetical protein Pla111_02810 [Botrimarina hoheduenensis]